MKRFAVCQGLVMGTVLLGSCQSQKVPFYFSSRPAAVALQPVVALAPAMSAKPLPLITPELQTHPCRRPNQSIARTPKRLAVIAKAAAIPLVSTRRLVAHPNHLQYASKRHYAPKEGGAKALAAIMRVLSIVAIVLGVGLIMAGISLSSVGIGGIIIGAILFIAGLIVQIDLSKY